jgi:heme A synthase
MRKTYTGIAWAIAGGVVVQAAAIAFGFGGMAHYIQEGGVVDKALVESRQATFTGDLGFPIHEIVGGMVLPLLALVLLGISFFVRLPGARKWAAILFGLVFLQVMAGYSIKDMPYLGVLHGANALAVLITAVVTARRARATSASPVAEPATADVPV